MFYMLSSPLPVFLCFPCKNKQLSPIPQKKLHTTISDAFQITLNQKVPHPLLPKPSLYIPFIKATKFQGRRQGGLGRHGVCTKQD
jgi:hypothetical protein